MSLAETQSTQSGKVFCLDRDDPGKTFSRYRGGVKKSWIAGLFPYFCGEASWFFMAGSTGNEKVIAFLCGLCASAREKLKFDGKLTITNKSLLD